MLTEAQFFRNALRRRFDAVAEIKGSQSYPDIMGTMHLYQTTNGVFVVTSVTGLPIGRDVASTPSAIHITTAEAASATQGIPLPMQAPITIRTIVLILTTQAICRRFSSITVTPGCISHRSFPGGGCYRTACDHPRRSGRLPHTALRQLRR